HLVSQEFPRIANQSERCLPAPAPPKKKANARQARSWRIRTVDNYRRPPRACSCRIACGSGNALFTLLMFAGADQVVGFAEALAGAADSREEYREHTESKDTGAEHAHKRMSAHQVKAPAHEKSEDRNEGNKINPERVLHDFFFIRSVG